MTICQSITFTLPFSSRQVAYATSGEYTSCTDFYALFTLHIYIFFFFLSSVTCTLRFIFLNSHVSCSLLTHVSFHCPHDNYSFSSMQHSLANNSLKALSIYTDLSTIPLIQNLVYFITAKYNRKSRYSELR